MNLQPKKVFQANDLIHNRFLVLGKLDNKKHSSIILKGFDKELHNFVVIKITSAAYREKSKVVTKILQKLDAGQGVPRIIWRGVEGPNTFTVTECLGPNLKKLFLLMDKQLTVATICMIAIQVLNTVEYIHSHDYVCCNIMPKEILISLHKKNLTLFITDYKQARKVKSNRLGGGTDQTSHTANKSILNKFSSVNLHLGLAASKKDDLESLAYILVYFFKKGNLFDRGSKSLTKEEKIKYYEQQKLSIIPETFCQGLPAEMTTFMTYIKSIQTNQTEKLDYELLRKQFKSLLSKQASTDIFQYDWIDKARTYNLDPNSSKNPSEFTIISPRSEAASDIESRTGESLSPDQQHKQEPKNEFDFLDVDEFPDNAKRPSISDVGSFEEKVKTISHVKRSSILSGKTNDTYTKNRSNSEARDHKSSTSEELPWTVKIEDFQRPKTKSVTETIKVSKFGKAYANKESKSS